MAEVDLASLVVDSLTLKSGEATQFITDYQQAAALARRLRCFSPEQYWEKVDQALGLPYFPDIFFHNRGWRGDLSPEQAWSDYLFPHPMIEKDRADALKELKGFIKEAKNLEIVEPTNEADTGIYSYQEAIEVNFKLQFQTIAMYRKNCKQDPRLAEYPEQRYGADFRWYYYLGLYQLKDLLALIRQGSISKVSQYRHLAARDKRVPLEAVVYHDRMLASISDLIFAAWNSGNT